MDTTAPQIDNWATNEAATFDHSSEALTRSSRARIVRRLERRERWSAIAFAVAFLVSAVAAAILIDGGRSFSMWVAVLLVVAYAGASHVEFEVGAGSAVPTQLVLVPMLFLLPLGLVPICVALGLLAGAILDHVRHGASLERAIAAVPVGSIHAFGPVLVLSLATLTEPRLADIPVYLAALAAQFAFDFAASAGREWFVLGVQAREMAPYLAWVYAVDVMLAAVGLAVAIAAQQSAAGALLALPLVGLLAYFARERQARIDHALELSTAYRGTALLLGDVVERDDEYTGLHSRAVVDLALAVADELDVSARQRQRVEFAALLHDVGKIRIPKRIINKPGRLNAAEWELIKTHTIEGERMLQNVGGLLADVGHIVRSCHERWDGAGYPDGLAGEAIPLEARIIIACDSFSAMTADRSYRAARSIDDALAEMQACSGTQFDPRVVAAFARGHIPVRARGTSHLSRAG